MVTLDNYNEICAIYLTLIEDLKGREIKVEMTFVPLSYL